MNIRYPRSGNAARIAKDFLRTEGLNITHTQAKELVARLHGYANAQAMAADSRFADAPALRPESSHEYVMTGPKQSSVWIGVENVSVYLKKADEGVVVDFFIKGHEDEESLQSAWLEYNDAKLCCERCSSELDEHEYCTDATCPYSDWPQKVKVTDLQEMPQASIEAKYQLKKRAS